MTRDKDGLFTGEEFTIQLHRMNESVIEDIVVYNWEEGVGVYSVNGISIAGSLSQSILIPKTLIKITDLIGREVDINTKHTTLLYIYDDGSVEKKYIIK